MKKSTLCILPVLLFFQLSAAQVSVTVYNQNLALVREIRTVSIDKGISSLSYRDVASGIEPTSVHFKSITAPEKLQLLEQNYEYDLIGSTKILQKYVDHPVRLVSTEGELFEGTLLSVHSDIVLRQADASIQILPRNQIQHYDFPKLPEGLITRPTLIWLVSNAGPQQQKTELSYLTSGMNWHAEYVAVTNEDDSNMEISGWVSIQNNSGATYKDAALKLVAGDVNRVQKQTRGRPEVRMYAMDKVAAPAPTFEEKAFYEYHLYTLQRQTTLKDNQNKQLSLFPSADTDIDKLYIYRSARAEDKVGVYLEFKNKKSSGLGLPLPKGTVRIYKTDSDGAQEFIGEDQIDHTPVDETIRLFTGNAFDIGVERTIKDKNKISTRSRSVSVEIKLRNRKKKKVDVIVSEPLNGDWRITESSVPHHKKDAFTAEFTVSIPAGGEKTLTYTFITKW